MLVQAKKPTLGTRLLSEWIEGGTMKLINNRNVITRLDPGKGTGSVLDLAIVSANIEESVTQFTVDSQRKMTAFAMIKNKNKTVEKKVYRSFYDQSETKNPYENFYQR